METKHWVGIVVIFVIGYFVGAKFPHFAGGIVGTVPSVSP